MREERRIEKLTALQQSQEDEYIFPYHYADLFFELYKQIYCLDYLSMLRTIKELLEPFEGQRILDAGCGDGRFCHELRGENVKVVGIDFSQKALAFAKAFNDSVEFKQADLANLKYKEAFDVVTLIEVLEHLPPNIIPRVVANLWKALKPEGKLVVSVPTIRMPLSRKHYQHFTSEKLDGYFQPLFVTLRKIGHCKGGKARERFIRLCQYAEWFWCLRRKTVGKQLLKYMHDYYSRQIEFCTIEEATRLIVLFKKENKRIGKQL